VAYHYSILWSRYFAREEREEESPSSLETREQQMKGERGEVVVEQQRQVPAWPTN